MRLVFSGEKFARDDPAGVYDWGVRHEVLCDGRRVFMSNKKLLDIKLG
jgi:hypothetical protein